MNCAARSIASRMKRRFSSGVRVDRLGASAMRELYSTEGGRGQVGQVGQVVGGQAGVRVEAAGRLLRAQQQDRHLHQVADAVGGGAEQEVGEEPVAVRRHRDQVDAAALRRALISSVAGSPIASRVSTVKPARRRARRAAARGRRGPTSSPRTRAASADRNCAPPSRRRRGRAGAPRRSAAPAPTTCVRIVRSAGEFSTATRMRRYMAMTARERLIQQVDVQRGDDNRDRSTPAPSPRAGSRTGPSCAGRS